MAHDVFISYAVKDKTIADAMCATLESKKIRCWMAPRDVLPGVAYAEAIIDAINECQLMVLIFSSHSNDSIFVKKELERGVSKGKPIIPFRIEDIPLAGEMELFVSSFHWLDAFTPPLQKHLEYLAETVQLLLSRKHKDDPTITSEKKIKVSAPKKEEIMLFPDIGSSDNKKIDTTKLAPYFCQILNQPDISSLISKFGEVDYQEYKSMTSTTKSWKVKTNIVNITYKYRENIRKNEKNQFAFSFILSALHQPIFESKSKAKSWLSNFGKLFYDFTLKEWAAVDLYNPIGFIDYFKYTVMNYSWRVSVGTGLYEVKVYWQNSKYQYANQRFCNQRK